MSVNIFFTAIGVLLVGIFVFFRPTESVRPNYKEVAQLDLTAFTVYEMDQNGLIRIMHGKQGQRFSNRYEVRYISYTDNNGPRPKYMTADFGRSKDARLDLQGHVVIREEGGYELEAEEVVYEKNKHLVTSPKSFVLIDGANRVTGSSLRYRIDREIVKADKIDATYIITNEKGKSE